jgi:autotransporter-associated beta strand protein
MKILLPQNPRTLALLAASLLHSDPVLSQTNTYWDGGVNGNGTFWSTATNWFGDEIPTNAADSNVIFDNRNGTHLIANMTISGTRVFGLVTFDNINGRLPATLEINTNSTGTTARSLTLHTGITLQNTATTVIFAGRNGTLSVVLGANNVLTTSADSSLEFSSAVAISGGFRLTKQGAGTLTLGASNSFTGGVTISEGTLRITQGLALGTNPSSYVADQILINGGTLDYNTASSFNSASNRGFSLGNAGGTIRVSNVGNYQISAVIADAAGQIGSLIKAGAGTLILSGTNTHTGGTVINEGTLRISQASGLGATPAAVMPNHATLNGGTLEFNSTSLSTKPLSKNIHLQRWVTKMAALCKPDKIHWVDGSKAEYDRLCNEMVDAGTFVRLNQKTWPGCFYAKSDPSDVARVEERTYICSNSKGGAGPTNNWMDPFEMKDKLRKLFNGCMKGARCMCSHLAWDPSAHPCRKSVCNSRIRLTWWSTCGSWPASERRFSN